MWPNPQFPANLVTFTEEILNGKFHFLCSASRLTFSFKNFVQIVNYIWFLRKDFFQELLYIQANIQNHIKFSKIEASFYPIFNQIFYQINYMKFDHSRFGNFHIIQLWFLFFQMSIQKISLHKNEFFIKDFFSKCDQIRSFLCTAMYHLTIL